MRQLAEKLRDQRKLKVWLDEWELPPGRPWQDELDKIIRTVCSVAVVVGRDGLGPWELPEMRACLSQMVNRELPVIPVLLPGAPEAPDLPVFLAQNTWVDLRSGINEDGLDRLVWGIKGKKPTRKPKQAPKPAGPEIHNLPFLPIGDLLKGRDQDLGRLETSLQGQSDATAITQTLHGLGGIGKTRLVVEYAYRSGDRYEAVLFVTADSPEAVRSGLANLARPNLLNLPEYRAKAEAETVEAVLRWLRDHSRWLLILDNVDTEEAARVVQESLPQLQRGHVLITSRRKEWPVGIRKQPLGTLSLDESTQFLLQRTEGERTPAKDDAEQARHLAEILDGLPLALEQAGAYIVHHQTSFASYLEDWERGRESVLAWHDETVMQYPTSVAATWQTTFQQLSPKAATVLRLTAFLAPDPIPNAIFEAGDSIIEEAVQLFRKEVAEAPVGPRSARDALSELTSYSMLTRRGETFTVHRIVQEVLCAHIPDEHRKDWIERSLRLVDEFSPPTPSDVRTWPVWDLLRPHAAIVVDKADNAEIVDPTVRLMGNLGLLLYFKSLYAEAEPMMRRALEIAEAAFGPQDPTVAITLSNLGLLLRDTNRLAEAEPIMRRALEIQKTALGAQHPSVAIDLNSLALLLQDTNRLAEAEPMMRRALEIDEAAFGAQHPYVARDLGNLALLLWDTNRLAEAEPMMWRALEIDEAAFGAQHPNVALRLNNLAQVLQDTNRLAEAEPMMRRALKLDEAVFGAQHPAVGRDLNNLARLLLDTNRLAEAEPMMRRALEIDEAAFGGQHPNVAIDLSNLAQLHRATSRLAEAEPMMRRAMEIRERSLGPDHPKTEIYRKLLADLLEELASKLEPPLDPEKSME